MPSRMIRLSRKEIVHFATALYCRPLWFKDVLTNLCEGLPVELWVKDAASTSNVLALTPWDDEQGDGLSMNLYACDSDWGRLALRQAESVGRVAELTIHHPWPTAESELFPDLVWRMETDLRWLARTQWRPNLEGVSIRLLRSHDRGVLWDFLWSSSDLPNHLRSDILVDLDDSAFRIWGLWHQNSLAAFLSAGPFFMDFWDVEFIYTAKQHRRCGFGSLLAAVYAATVHSMGKVPLYCSPVNQTSQRTAERAGFGVYKRRLHGMTRDNWQRLPDFAD